jgi:thiamine phosphate synthase YjbQ (UPF0047 family)
MEKLAALAIKECAANDEDFQRFMSRLLPGGEGASHADQ